MQNYDFKAETFSEHRYSLAAKGWTLLENFRGQDHVLDALVRFGELLPQFDGNIEHQVKAVPGYDAMRFSKSRNEIGPHTEGPIYPAPPKYLALYCHRQARCGSGHTALADGLDFLHSLTAEERAFCQNYTVSFSTYNDATGYEATDVKFPLETRRDNGQFILRFSHNLFYFGDLHAANESPSEQAASREQKEFSDIVARCTDFFEQQKLRILIPDGALLIWDNHRMLHARSEYADTDRHLTRYWLS
ncbi:TauD/TfdA family dioxygenase [Haliangium ochraceum]|uniref:TauD/TfdA-like domain-containing protein n=1 Tax=Haliangium ochraceum (strain DSM 14365 / JCM 11303 / SMP-2) TaxID=502025 RepID=D0LLC5_HALO1|nr:TauD/TfdA family dioxygenase [Haliangium ochraceum]ACY18621.1 conserved hypothetical protein [Haliangium ochraceum DSM 14365]